MNLLSAHLHYTTDYVYPQILILLHLPSIAYILHDVSSPTAKIVVHSLLISLFPLQEKKTAIIVHTDWPSRSRAPVLIGP